MKQESSPCKSFKELPYNIFTLSQIIDNLICQNFNIQFYLSKDIGQDTCMIRIGKKVDTDTNYQFIEKSVPINYLHNMKKLITTINYLCQKLIDKL